MPPRGSHNFTPAEKRQHQLERFEEFCCDQTGRLKHRLAMRYTYDHSDDTHWEARPGDHALGITLPQNDHMSRRMIYVDCDQEMRK
mgnify:FL=1